MRPTNSHMPLATRRSLPLAAGAVPAILPGAVPAPNPSTVVLLMLPVTLELELEPELELELAGGAGRVLVPLLALGDANRFVFAGELEDGWCCWWWWWWCTLLLVAATAAEEKAEGEEEDDIISRDKTCVRSRWNRSRMTGSVNVRDCACDTNRLMSVPTWALTAGGRLCADSSTD